MKVVRRRHRAGASTRSPTCSARTAEVVVTPGQPRHPRLDGHAARASSTPTCSSIGPEAPLVDGLADRLRAAGQAGVRPRRRRRPARGLEGVDEGGARRRPACRPPATARSPRSSRRSTFLARCPGLYVVKTDGLAAGKGVLVTESLAEAEDDVRAKLSGAAFGDAGRTVVIEEGLTGPELSVLRGVRRHARRAARAGPGLQAGRRRRRRAQHRRHGRVLAGAGRRRRRRRRGDRRGSSSPTLAALRGRGIDYRGVLYAGLMLTADGPEAARVQRPLRRPRGPGRAAPARRPTSPSCWPRRPPGALATAPDVRRRRRRHASCCAAEGYPDAPRTGDVIDGHRRRRARSTASPSSAPASAGDARRRARHRRRPGARRRSAGAPTSPTPGRGPTTASAASAGPGMHYRTDIAAEAADRR